MNSTLTNRSAVSREIDLARYVGGSHFDETTNQINGSAFDRMPKDHDGLSVNRCGVFDSNVDLDRQAMRVVTASRMKVGKTAVFIQFNTGAALDALAEFNQEILICEDPLPADGAALANPAHALVVGLPFKGESLGSLKSELAGARLRATIFDRFSATLIPTDDVT